MKWLTMTFFALILSGCTSGFLETADSRKAAITFLQATVASYNAAGIDPVQLDDSKLAILTASCATLVGVNTLVRPDFPEADAELLGFCATVAQAAAPAPE